MSLFKPVLVEHKTSLDSVTKVNGQYIIVVDTKEIYVDRLAADGTVERVGVNRGNVFLQSNEPVNPVEGDIWLQTEATITPSILKGTWKRVNANAVVPTNAAGISQVYAPMVYNENTNITMLYITVQNIDGVTPGGISIMYMKEGDMAPYGSVDIGETLTFPESNEITFSGSHTVDDLLKLVQCYFEKVSD